MRGGRVPGDFLFETWVRALTVGCLVREPATMLRGLACLILTLTTPSVALRATKGPMNWSPDGRWVAYTESRGAGRPVFSADWLFNPSDESPPWTLAPLAENQKADRLPCRIYAAEAETGASILLYEADGPLTSPAWRPDGRALAFGRVVHESPAPPRLELIVQDAPGENRVILSQPLGEMPATPFEWAAVSPSWSPDGRYLAVEGFKAGAGFSVIQAETGRLIRSFEGSAPTWSLDGTKLAFLRVEKSTSLFMTEISVGPVENPEAGAAAGSDPIFSPPKHLADLGPTSIPPVWSRDGRSILAVARRMVFRGRGPSLQVDLVRVSLSSATIVGMAHLTPDPIEDERFYHGVALTFGQELDQIFYAPEIDNQPTSIVWFRPRNQETVERFNPIDFTVRISGLSLSPDGKTLALRAVDNDHGSVALYDLVTRKTTLLAPDDATRLEWTSLLITTARRLLQETFATVAANSDKAVWRPTLLPVPGEIPQNQEFFLRLRRLGRLGEPLCDAPAASDDPALETYLQEASLVFDTLREDYQAALKSLESLEARTTSADRLVRLLAVRAQLFLGTKDVVRATDTINFLKTLEDAPVSRLEVTPAGATLTSEPFGAKGWARYLSRRLDDLDKTRVRPPVDADDLPAANNPNELLEPGPQRPERLPFNPPPNGMFIVPVPPAPPAQPFNPPPQNPFRGPGARRDGRAAWPRAPRAPFLGR